jgi:hypothetical protein
MRSVLGFVPGKATEVKYANETTKIFFTSLAAAVPAVKILLGT